MTDDTTIINRRETDPDDSERLSLRRGIREQAGKRDMELTPALVAEADIEVSQARVDQAADEHSTATAPLQAELSTLEAAAIQRIADRLPPDPEADARRGRVSEIAALTRELEATVAHQQKLQQSLLQKIQYLRQGHPPPDTILAALGRPPAANPRLLAELFIARERIKWLQARHRAAEKALGICRYNLEEIEAGRMTGDLGFFVGKTASWQAESDVAGRELTDAMAASTAAYQAIVDE